MLAKVIWLTAAQFYSKILKQSVALPIVLRRGNSTHLTHPLGNGLWLCQNQLEWNDFPFNGQNGPLDAQGLKAIAEHSRIQDRGTCLDHWIVVSPEGHHQLASHIKIKIQ